MLLKIDEKIKNLKNDDINNENKKIKIKEKIDKLKRDKKNKQSLKNLSLTTSKTNYIDPRIIFSFIKKINLIIDDKISLLKKENYNENNWIPIEKFLSKILIEKYNWASNINEDFNF
jgi:DNA topoisomerase-1